MTILYRFILIFSWFYRLPKTFLNRVFPFGTRAIAFGKRAIGKKVSGEKSNGLAHMRADMITDGNNHIEIIIGNIVVFSICGSCSEIPNN